MNIIQPTRAKEIFENLAHTTPGVKNLSFETTKVRSIDSDL